MEKKINIAELLKDCPSGMELDCMMYEDVFFDYVDELNIIHCYIQHETHKTSITFNQHGTPDSDIKSKCVIFPKGKTTWEGFTLPYQFRDGDVVSTNSGIWIAITTGGQSGTLVPTYCVIQYGGKFEAYIDRKERWGFNRFATEEEKQKLFKAIKDNGYKWNPETKTLEKLPKFKVGDRVKHLSAYTSGIIVKVDDKGYHINYPKSEGVCYISFTLEKDYELVPKKFDITTLVPFESRVLVRDTDHYEWEGAVFGRYDGNTFFTIGGIDWRYCIPYEGNEHLLGTTDDCDDFYKTWEK